MMKNAVLTAACVSLYSFFTVSSHAAVTGTVKDTDGEPVAGALVTFIDESDAEASFHDYTDDSGCYEIGLSTVHADVREPVSFILHQNSPNPFNPSTSIAFTLETDGLAHLSIFNITGQHVKTLVGSRRSAGRHTVTWDGRDDAGLEVAAGVYLYRLISGGHSSVKKMVLIDGGDRDLTVSATVVNVPRFRFADKTAEEKTYTVTITGTGIVSYRQTGVTVVSGQTMDFVVSLIRELSFVSIPAGTFRMGDIQDVGNNNEHPVHSVTVGAFEMSVCEVTCAQYVEYLNDALTSNEITVLSLPFEVRGAAGDYIDMIYFDLGDAEHRIAYSNGEFSVVAGYDNHALVEVSWYGAKAFAGYYGFDLPTEAEWEYACRAGTETLFYTGNNVDDDWETSPDLDKASWYHYNSETDDNYPWTHPVGEKEPNAFGLYDMLGNVWEWCHDWYGEYYYSMSPSDNPPGPIPGIYRVRRGGDWSSSAFGCRSAFRAYRLPFSGQYHIGFRVVRRESSLIY